MTMTLPRSATYIQRRLNTPCSRVGCTWPGRYGTASGSRWCIRCYQRLQLVEMAQYAYLHSEWWLDLKARETSELAQCVKWISNADEWKIGVVCKLLEVA